jgi:hypothetical protein
MSKSNVNPNHYKVAGRERQGEDIAQIRNKQMLAESLVRRRYEPGAIFQKPAPVHDAAPDAAPTPAPEKKHTETTRSAAAKRTTGKPTTPKRASARRTKTKRATTKRASTKPARKRANVQKAHTRGNASRTRKRTRR